MYSSDDFHECKQVCSASSNLLFIYIYKQTNIWSGDIISSSMGSKGKIRELQNSIKKWIKMWIGKKNQLITKQSIKVMPKWWYVQ